MTDQATARAEKDFVDAMKKARGDEGPAVPGRPLGDRLLVRPEELEELTTPGGLVVPPSAQDDVQVGEVIAVGPGTVDGGHYDDDTFVALHIPLAVQVGDVVYYGRFAGTSVEIDGDEYLVLREPDIMLVME